MTGRHEAYLYHVNFNAMHNMVVDSPKKMHAHTFRVGMYVHEEKDQQAGFLDTESMLQAYFERYQGIRLNEMEVFRNVIPTLEYMGEVFYRDLKELFQKNGMNLLVLEIGDSPVSTFCIGESILLGDVYNRVDTKEIENYCQRVREHYKKTE